MIGNRYGSIITDDNKTHGYYIVKWDRTPHEYKKIPKIFKKVM